MPDIQMNILELVLNAYQNLTAAERKVADYVLEAGTSVQFMSITQLAEECGVADATVSRFCRTLELPGFNAFKIALAKYSGSRPAIQGNLTTETVDGRRAEVCSLAMEAVQQTSELLDSKNVAQAITLFEKAPRVLCFGSGASIIMASACAQLFSTVCNKFTAVSDSHSQLSATATADENDVIVLFSYSGSTTIGLQILELARNRGIRTVLVTRYAKSPAAKLADIVLCCGANEGPFQPGSVPAKIAQLVVVDILYQEYRHRNQHSSDEHIQAIASSLSRDHM